MKFTTIIDTREKNPLSLETPVIRRKLDSGDYSILGLEHRVAFERKSKEDLVQCVRSSRKRFEAQLERLCRYEYRAVIIEGAYHEFGMKFWHSQATIPQVLNSIAAWSLWGVPFIFCSSERMAAAHVSRAFTSIARLVARENQHIQVKGEELCSRSQSQAI